MPDEVNKEVPDKNTTKPTVQLPAFPENSNVRIYIDGRKDRWADRIVPADREHEPDYNALGNTAPVFEEEKLSLRGIGTLIGGFIGAIAGFFGGSIYVDNKMFDFDAEVYKRTQDNILGRRGLGAAAAESSSTLGANLGSMAPGMASHEIHMANTLTVAKEGNHPFAKFIYKTLGGNRSAIPLATAAVLGTATAVAACVAMHPKKEAKVDTAEPGTQSTDWQTRVEQAKTDEHAKVI
jgi:hypothetical protein